MSGQQNNLLKQAKTDRLFKLNKKDGGSAKDVTGMVDPRLFSGDNHLHIKKDPETNFWYFHYDKGIPPESLKCHFTSFPYALRYAENYYLQRNVEIKEVDAPTSTAK